MNIDSMDNKQILLENDVSRVKSSDEIIVRCMKTKGHFYSELILYSPIMLFYLASLITIYF